MAEGRRGDPIGQRLVVEYLEDSVIQGKNRYFRRSPLSEAKFRVIICSFALDLPASKIAELSGVSRPAINQLLLKLRIGVAQVWDASSSFSGEVEVDESYFGARRSKVI